jgi:CubicO group peptidase (beta-lactamase class C family)
MKKIYLLIGFILAVSLVRSQNNNQSNQNIENKIDEYLRAFSGNNLGGVVSVFQKGEIKFEKAYGLSDISDLTKMKLDNRFNMIGLSKSFTAVAIMKLVEKGKIGLEDNLLTLFNDFPDYGSQVKVKHLLSHTSGLQAYSENDVQSQSEVLEFLKNEKDLKFKPETTMEHSNSDYALLAIIIEKVSGMSYSDFLNANIFKKLKMEYTVVASSISGMDNIAFPYSLANKRYNKNETKNSIYGEQGIYSNVYDIAKWDKALYTNKLLKCEYLSEIFQENKLNEGKTPTYYGYGWVLMERNNTPYYWHGGTDNGYTNLIFHLPNSQLTVVILVNREDAKDLFKNALAIAKLFDNNINL